MQNYLGDDAFYLKYRIKWVVIRKQGTEGHFRITPTDVLETKIKRLLATGKAD